MIKGIATALLLLMLYGAESASAADIECAQPTFRVLFSTVCKIARISLLDPTATPTLQYAEFPSIQAKSTTSARYQMFERGFMLWRADLNCVYAVQYHDDLPPHMGRGLTVGPNDRSYGYCLDVAPLLTQPLQGSQTPQTLPVPTATPSTDLLIPTGAIGLVWDSYTLQPDLGYATQPEQAYLADVPGNGAGVTIPGEDYYVSQLTVPDGRSLACGAGGGVAGVCLY
jgi:hypothetical protein